ncbi:MAG: fructose-bisphosphate aldolase class I [Chloroflexi bacterium]|nr:fructose-bisphosphate aldolase class I [Chloroflexota bacterium]
MDKLALMALAKALVAPGKGILAADESSSTATRRLKSVGVESTAETRRAYRKMLLTTPEIERYISGVILYDETARQNVDHTSFPVYLADRGIVPGIKVDTGAKPLAGYPGEQITEGLDGLRERLAEYARLGCRFAKWRAVIAIGDGLPTPFCLAANARALARYAALCQEQGLVPVVEPEVLMDGDHTIERCEAATLEALRALFAALAEHRVLLEGLLLKPNMVLAGKGCPAQADVKTVAEATLRTLRRAVPGAVPGIVFLSGGQEAELATAHLDAMNRAGAQPWQVSFSFARALQEPALNAWRGVEANVPAAQALFLKRARLNGAARKGEYTVEMEK